MRESERKRAREIGREIENECARQRQSEARFIHTFARQV